MTVEFALLAPVLFLLVLGIIDFGWAFGQHIDVRTAAREGGRLAIVNGGSGPTADARRNDLIAKVKQRSADLTDSDTAVYIRAVDDDLDGIAGEIGETAVVCVRYPLTSLSGLFQSVLTGSLESKSVMRMEKIANFSSGGSSSPAWDVDQPCDP